MRTVGFLIALMALGPAWISSPVAAAVSCKVPADAGLVCPVRGGGEVRPGDACAREGGTVHANRGTGRFHNALDINTPEGTIVYAARAGRVALASSNWGALGNTVIIDHADGEYTIYGHLRVMKVRRNSCVGAGSVVGAVGYTGNAKCLRDNHLIAHLHFGVIRASRAGLVDRNGPLAAAIKTNDRWQQFGKKYFVGGGLGIQDPEAMLQGVAGCLR